MDQLSTKTYSLNKEFIIMKKYKNLDVIIPISMELDWPTRESIVSTVLEQYRNYGFTRFALAVPGGGWRSVGYPSKDFFEERANFFLQVKNDLIPYGIECGWWITATIKSGASTEFGRMVRIDGSETPFSSCPLDSAFRKRFAGDVALFAKIAKPEFIIVEDDFSIFASAGLQGCFCKHHLDEFAKRQGRYYSREELIQIFSKDITESVEILKKWRELTRDSLVYFSEAVREAVDKDSPEIPMGYMQSGVADYEGDCTEAVCKALAGPNHTPFSRFYGTFYGGINVQEIPHVLYHPLYSKQHINGDFLFYHESDTFPHTRFYAAGSQMRAVMSTAYSFGYDGSTFQTQQLLDEPNEETAYGKMFTEERAQFNAIHKIAQQCDVKGVQLPYDPFWNTVDKTKSSNIPLWTKCLGLFGIPYTTIEADVAFWDERQAKYMDDTTIKKYLSKGLFLDGDAAKCLCGRGYGEYLGVEIGDNVADGTVRFDLGAREVICEPFTRKGKGENMPSAHMYSPGGNGKLLRMTVIDEHCEIVTEAYTFQKQFISVAMTRFENKLGGRIVVMGMTLDRNNSQSLFNYRRQRLLQDLLVWCNDKYVFAKEAAEVFVIMNEAINPNESPFKGMLTLINLCADDLDELALHMPPQWQDSIQLCVLDQSGEWKELEYTKTDDGIVIQQKLKTLSPMYILGSVPETV